MWKKGQIKWTQFACDRATMVWRWRRYDAFAHYRCTYHFLMSLRLSPRPPKPAVCYRMAYTHTQLSGEIEFVGRFGIVTDGFLGEFFGFCLLRFALLVCVPLACTYLCYYRVNREGTCAISLPFPSLHTHTHGCWASCSSLCYGYYFVPWRWWFVQARANCSYFCHPLPRGPRPVCLRNCLGDD